MSTLSANTIKVVSNEVLKPLSRLDRLSGQLFKAAEDNHFQAIRQIVKQKGIEVDRRDQFNETALMKGCRRGHLKVAEALVAAGANLNLQDQSMCTALHYASKHSKKEVVQYLIEQGADVTKKDDEGRTALDVADEYTKRIFSTTRSKVQTGSIHTAERSSEEKQVTAAAPVATADVSARKPLPPASAPAPTPYGLVSIGTSPAPTAPKSVGQAVVAAEQAVLLPQSKLDRLWEQLVNAARDNHLMAVRQILSHKGIAVDRKDKLNETALMKACRGGYLKIVKELVAAGANINLCCQNARTALHCASACGHVEIVQYLIERGANVNQKDDKGNVLFDVAADESTKATFSTARCQTSAGPSSTPVILTSSEADAKMEVEATRAVGPDNSAKATTQPVKAVALCNDTGDSVVEPIALLTDKLYEAAGGGDVEQVKQLLSTPGLRIDQRIQNSETALIQACYVGHLEVVRLLVEVGGADLNLQDQDGWTALHWAAYNKHVPVVTFLLTKGADKGSTALQSTSDQAVKDVFAGRATPPRAATGDELIPSPVRTADAVDISPITGLSETELNNLLYATAGAGDVNKMRRLLNTPGVNIDFKYQNSETALIQACYEGHLPVAQLLVEKGANLNLRDQDGWTALHWAAYNGNAELVKLLLRKGADTTILSKKGSTAQQSASNEGIRSLFTA